MKKTLLITSMIMGGVFGSLTAQAASKVLLTSASLFKKRAAKILPLI